MPKTHRFAVENRKEIDILLKNTTDSKLYRKLEDLKLRMDGYSNTEIAEITGYSKSRVSAIVCIYANEGISYFKREHRTGGNHRNLAFDEEVILLSEFEQLAQNGNIVTVSDIKTAYDEKCGHESGSGTIYMVLKRHGWRKSCLAPNTQRKQATRQLKPQKINERYHELMSEYSDKYKNIRIMFQDEAGFGRINNLSIVGV